jgi:hypothetical protein
MVLPRTTCVVLLVLAALCAALALPLSATAGEDDGGDDVRRTGSCTGSSETRLRLRADDDTIRIELEVETRRRRSTWTVILLHERRIAFRGRLRARDDGSVRLRRTVPDWFGSDTVAARAVGPGPETCRVSASL